jgi:hypothetical protein
MNLMNLTNLTNLINQLKQALIIHNLQQFNT